MTIETIVDRHKLGQFKSEDWEKLGLINDKLANEQKPQVEELLNEVSFRILKTNQDEALAKSKLKYLLPGVVRVYIQLVNSYSRNLLDKDLNLDLEIYHIIDTSDFIKDFENHWPKVLEELKRFEYIDSEVHFLGLFSQNFANKILEILKNKTNIQILEIIRDKKLEKIIRTKD